MKIRYKPKSPIVVLFTAIIFFMLTELDRYFKDNDYNIDISKCIPYIFITVIFYIPILLLIIFWMIDPVERKIKQVITFFIKKNG